MSYERGMDVVVAGVGNNGVPQGSVLGRVYGTCVISYLTKFASFGLIGKLRNKNFCF